MTIEQLKVKNFELIDGVMHCNGEPFIFPKDEYLNYDGWVMYVHPDIKWYYEYDGDWQGDWAAIGIKDNNYYYITGYYGSCSLCDWLQGIEPLGNNKDSLEFLGTIGTLIKFDNPNECEKYLKKEQINSFGIATLLEKLIEQLNSGEISS